MKTYSITDVGISRTMNQDYYYTSEISVGNLPNLFIVADGMGGHNAGEYASKYAVETIVRAVEASKSTKPQEIFEDAIKEANRHLLQKASEDVSMSGMGTTVVVLSIIGNTIHVANVGDSRLYLVNHEMHQITRDHSLVEEMVRRGEMDKELAREHPDKNIITRAVGAIEDIEVDYFEAEICPEDEILMCTDGLTNMLEDEPIRRIMKGQRDTAEKAERLIEAANKNGGKDNITVVVIKPFSDEVNDRG